MRLPIHSSSLRPASVFCSAFALFAGATATAADTATDGYPAESAGGLPQMDVSTFPSQIFWLLITFALLYFVCSKIFLPRIGGIIEERRNRIADDMDQAAQYKLEAEQAEASYLKALADAKARAATIAAETRAILDAEIAENEAEANAKFERDITAAEARIADVTERAKGEVREAAAETTKALVETLIGEQPSDDIVEAALTQAGA